MKCSSFLIIAVLYLGILGLGMFKPAQAQTVKFEMTWGGKNSDSGRSVAVDASGNIYVTGETFSFGVGGFGISDAFLLKYDSTGGLVWQKTWGGTNDDGGRGVAVGASGDPAPFTTSIYVTGFTYSMSKPGSEDAFLLKYNLAGGLVWQKTWGAKKSETGNGVAVDASGNIYVAGGTSSFGAGGSDAFLLKYDSTGGLVWQKTWGGTDDDEGNGVAVDAAANIYVAGETSSFGVGGFGMSDAFLLKYDSTGGLVWQKTWGGNDDEFGNGVAVDASGNIYVAGGTYSFGAGYSNAFLLKYDSTGGLVWQKTWGVKSEFGNGVAVDASGNIYVAGGTSSFGFGAGGTDAFLLKYDSTGGLVWQKTWGGTSNEWSNGVAADASANIYLTGLTWEPTQILQGASGTETTPKGTETTPTVAGTTPAGISTAATGTETTPAGSQTYVQTQVAGDAFLVVLNPEEPPPRPIPEFPSWIILLAFLIVTMLVAVAIKRKNVH